MNTTDALDRINAVCQILDYLTANLKEDGLCHILTMCQEQLQVATIALNGGSDDE
jgi:hypothetical protein